MMRPNRSCAAAAARESHACAFRARQFSGTRMECACVRLASRCGGGRLIRPHRCAAFAERYNDAVESTVRHRRCSQISRSRFPRAQQSLLYAW
eukprot:3780643-Lingulodinium_polyedra.AAC.1